MARKVLEETRDNRGQYIGRIVSKDGWINDGSKFYMEVESITSGKTRRMKIGESGCYPEAGPYHGDIIRRPSFSDFSFTSSGLEIKVGQQIVSEDATPQERVLIPRSKFPK